MKQFFLCFALLALCACGTSKQNVASGYSAIPQQKGVLILRIGQKADSESGIFPDAQTSVTYKKIVDEDARKYRFEKIAAGAWSFEKVASGVYQKQDFVIEEEPGEYVAYPPIAFGRAPVKMQGVPFTIRPGQITYIGQYDIYTIYDTSGAFGAQLKKTTSHISNGGQRTVQDILKPYPNLKKYPVSNQAPIQEMAFRTRFTPAGPVYVDFTSYDRYRAGQR